MTKPRFFKTPQAFRTWLRKNHDKREELLVGFYKLDSGKPSMTWPESVDQALCFGWIDGIRRRIDDEAYSIRFTPRKAKSHWSKVNLEKSPRLIAAGLMEPAGLAAWKRRDGSNTVRASYERRYRFAPELRERFAGEAFAWSFWQKQPPGYRRTLTGWVMQGKQEPTRVRRLEKLIEACQAGKRLR